MADILRGNKLTGSTRPPKAHAKNRVCAGDGCETTLSQYNKRDHCFVHTPTRFPRLRGRVVTDS